MQIHEEPEDTRNKWVADRWSVFRGSSRKLPKVNLHKPLYLSTLYLGYCNNISDEAVLKLL